MTAPGLVEIVGPHPALIEICDTDTISSVIEVAGAPGPPGPRGQGLLYRGAHDPAIVYEVGDVVTHLGGTWVAAATTGPGAFDPPAWDSYTLPGHHTHTQAVPATVWTINHALGFDPAGILVVSDDGYPLDEVGVQILVPGSTVRLSFDISVAGVAYLS